jgi:hypothetical protein
VRRVRLRPHAPAAWEKHYQTKGNACNSKTSDGLSSHLEPYT